MPTSVAKLDQYYCQIRNNSKKNVELYVDNIYTKLQLPVFKYNYTKKTLIEA